MRFNRRTMMGLTFSAVFARAMPVFGQDRGNVFFLIPDSGSAFYTQSAEFMKLLVEDAGYQLNVLDASMRTDVQLNQMDNVLNLSPSAIVLAAVDFDAIAPQVEIARQSGVKVIAYDRSITNTPVDFTSVAGVVEMGRICARQMIEMLEKRNGEATGRVLQIMGDPGDNYALQLRDGFGEVMKDYPNIEVVTQSAHGWDPTLAANIAQDFLTVSDDADGIFLASGYYSAAVVGVLEALGKKPGDLSIVDGDGDASGFPLIKNGWQQAAVEAPLYAETYAVAAFLEQVLNGEKILEGQYDILGLKSELVDEPWGPTLRIPGRIITADNVGDNDLWGNMVFPKVEYKKASSLLVSAN